MATTIFGSGIRTEAKIGTNVVAPDGFRYPAALNASTRYHFAGTGRTTKGWFNPNILKDSIVRGGLRRLERALINDVVKAMSG